MSSSSSSTTSCASLGQQPIAKLTMLSTCNDCNNRRDKLILCSACHKKLCRGCFSDNCGITIAVCVHCLNEDSACKCGQTGRCAGNEMQFSLCGECSLSDYGRVSEQRRRVRVTDRFNLFLLKEFNTSWEAIVRNYKSFQRNMFERYTFAIAPQGLLLLKANRTGKVSVTPLLLDPTKSDMPVPSYSIHDFQRLDRQGPAPQTPAGSESSSSSSSSESESESESSSDSDSESDSSSDSDDDDDKAGKDVEEGEVEPQEEGSAAKKQKTS